MSTKSKVKRECWKLGNYNPSSIKYNEHHKYWDGYYYVSNVFCRVYAQKAFKQDGMFVSIDIFVNNMCYSFSYITEKVTERRLKLACTMYLKEILE